MKDSLKITNGDNISKKGYIFSEQIPMFGHKDIIGYGTNDFYVKEIYVGTGTKYRTVYKSKDLKKALLWTVGD